MGRPIACTCTRVSVCDQERERETVFKISFVFLSREIGEASLATKGRELLIFLFVFADKVLSSLSDFSLSLVCCHCLVSVYPNPSGIVKIVYPFDFLTVFVLSGSV